MHHPYLHILRLILLASSIRDTILIDPTVHKVTVATIAGTSSTAVDEDLNGRNHVAHSAYERRERNQQ